MKLNGTIIITEGPRIDEKSRNVFLSEGEMDRAIAMVADDPVMQEWFARSTLPRGRRSWVFSFTVGDAKLRPMVELIKAATGRTPTPWRLLKSQENQGNHYFVRLRREYTPADLDKAPLLCLFSTQWLAKSAPRDHVGPLQVMGDKMLEKPKPFGRLDPYEARVMNTWLVEELKKRNLNGFTVKDVEILGRKSKHQPIWEPWSTVTMPRCCLPMVNSWGEPCGPADFNNRGCHHECGPYAPEELVFQRSEVDALGEFDIAVCQEYVGMGNNDRFSPIVVSQRFRQILKELKVTGVAYAPVWLKDPGEPLWTNPWEEILGPYPEPVPFVGENMKGMRWPPEFGP